MQRGDVPPEILKLVAAGDVDYTAHVWARLHAGDFDDEDIDHCILCGHVVKIQKDDHNEAVDGHKYVILGPDRGGALFYVCGKIMRDSESRFFLCITAHEEGG